MRLAFEIFLSRRHPDQISYATSCLISAPLALQCRGTTSMWMRFVLTAKTGIAGHACAAFCYPVWPEQTRMAWRHHKYFRNYL